jgi:hypothetical protein
MTESIGNQGDNKHSEHICMACQSCSRTAYLEKDWRPGQGLDPLLRKFVCKGGYKSYKSFTSQELIHLLASHGQTL